MDKAEKRRLKKLGKQIVQQQSAELQAALTEANPAPISSDNWGHGYRKGLLREKWLLKRFPRLHKEKLEAMFVVRPINEVGFVGHSEGYLQCQICFSALPSIPPKWWIYRAGCRCGNARWTRFLWWSSFKLRDGDKLVPVKLIGRA